MTEIYLDHNATTPLDPRVADAMAACQAAGLGNPASQHRAGRRARARVEDCRELIGRLLGADTAAPRPDRIIFTSGGTEANHLALFGMTAGRAGPLVISAIEHPSVEEPARRLAAQGRRLFRIPVDREGVVDVCECERLVAAGPALISVMLGNNETGVLQPVERITALAGAYGAPVHSDAVQAVGKIPVNFRELRLAAMSVAAHKFHGPTGIGALVVHGDVPLEPTLFGGHQQEGLRPGTEPVALIVGFARAVELWHQEREERRERMTALRERFEARLLAGCPELIVHGQAAPRLPHTSCVAFPGVDRQAMLIALDLAGVACSTGSACSSGSSEPSPVLVAMGLDSEVVGSSLRFSLGASTTTAEVDLAVARILEVHNDLRVRFSAGKRAGSGREQG